MTDYIRDLQPAEWGSGVGCTAAILSRSCPLWVKSRHQRMSASCPLYPRKRHQRAQWIFLCFPTHHKNTEAFGFSLRNLGLQFRIVLLIKPEQGNRLVRYASGTQQIICVIRK